ncbi:restriction endonuclease subunit S [Vibrio parahaemolyticus]|nr:restriction endonuclease subunit S [Vibrio parahaemolyticus]
MELPKGWVNCTPSDLTNDPKNEIVDGPFGSNLKASEYTDEGTPIVRIQNVKRMKFLDKNIKYVTNEKAEFLKRHSFQSGDLLITKLGEPLGLTCIVPNSVERGIIVADIVRLRPNQEVNKTFLAYLLNSEKVIQQINAHIKGSTRARINLSVVRNLNIAIPPLAEQKRIVEKLDEVLAQVDTIKARLDGIPDLLKRFRQSVLASAVSGKLTEEWRRDNGEDSSWKQITLKDAAHIQDPHPSHRTPPVVEGGIPFVSIGDLREDGSIDIENARKVSPEVLKEHKARYTLKEGDFIFGKIGTLGKATVLPMSVDFALSANVILIQPEISLAEPKYIQYFLSSPTTMDEVAKQANSTSQSAFGIKKMRAFVCSLPSKIEQTEIVRLVDQYFAFADTIEAQVKKAQARVDNLTQSILAKAFRGELVPQNDDDEPADKLLERIAQARKEAEALAKAAKKVEAAKKRAANKARV